MRGRLHSLVEREGFASPISRPRVESPRYAAWPCRARRHLGSTWSAVINLSPPGPVSYIYYIRHRGSPDRRPLKSADGRPRETPSDRHRVGGGEKARSRRRSRARTVWLGGPQRPKIHPCGISRNRLTLKSSHVPPASAVVAADWRSDLTAAWRHYVSMLPSS